MTEQLELVTEYQLLDTIDTAITDIDTLYRINDKCSDSPATESIQIRKICIENISDRLGIPITKKSNISTEEGVIAFLSNIWKAIVMTLKRIWRKIQDFFGIGNLSTEQKLKRRLEDARERLDFNVKNLESALIEYEESAKENINYSRDLVARYEEHQKSILSKQGVAVEDISENNNSIVQDILDRNPFYDCKGGFTFDNYLLTHDNILNLFDFCSNSLVYNRKALDEVNECLTEFFNSKEYSYDKSNTIDRFTKFSDDINTLFQKTHGVKKSEENRYILPIPFNNQEVYVSELGSIIPKLCLNKSNTYKNNIDNSKEEINKLFISFKNHARMLVRLSDEVMKKYEEIRKEICDVNLITSKLQVDLDRYFTNYHPNKENPNIKKLFISVTFPGLSNITRNMTFYSEICILGLHIIEYDNQIVKNMTEVLRKLSNVN